jgi:hypothetical protein
MVCILLQEALLQCHSAPAKVHTLTASTQDITCLASFDAAAMAGGPGSTVHIDTNTPIASDGSARSLEARLPVTYFTSRRPITFNFSTHNSASSALVQEESNGSILAQLAGLGYHPCPLHLHSCHNVRCCLPQVRSHCFLSNCHTLLQNTMHLCA